MTGCSVCSRGGDRVSTDYHTRFLIRLIVIVLVAGAIVVGTVGFILGRFVE
jgi:hypothetical protein